MRMKTTQVRMKITRVYQPLVYDQKPCQSITMIQYKETFLTAILYLHMYSLYRLKMLANTLQNTFRPTNTVILVQSL